MPPSEFDMITSHVPSHPPTHDPSQQQETVYPRSRNLFNLIHIGILGHSRQTSYQWLVSLVSVYSLSSPKVYLPCKNRLRCFASRI
jgi:hypothetical protein